MKAGPNVATFRYGSRYGNLYGALDQAEGGQAPGAGERTAMSPELEKDKQKRSLMDGLRLTAIVTGMLLGGVLIALVFFTSHAVLNTQEGAVAQEQTQQHQELNIPAEQVGAQGQTQDQGQPQSQQQTQTEPKQESLRPQLEGEFETEERAEDKLILEKMKEGGSDPLLSTLSPQAHAWRVHFKDVLLVVSFDRGHDAQYMNTSTRMIRQLYGRIFRRILVVAHEKFTDWGVHVVDVPVRGETAEHKKAFPGDFSYSALAELALSHDEMPKDMQDIVQHNLAGVLWMDSDVVINYWKLVYGDMTKVWLPAALMASQHFRFWTFSKKRRDDEFSPMPLSVEQHMQRITELWQQWPEWARDYHKQRQEDLHVMSGYKVDEVAVYRGVVPLFYLPRPVLQRIKPLVQLLKDNVISREFAVPLLLMSCAPKDKWDHALDEFSEGPNADLDVAAQVYHVANPGLSPWDYSNVLYWGRLIYMMQQADQSLKTLAEIWRRLGGGFR